MIEPYPDAAQMPGIQRQAPPASVLNAVKVMYAGAVAEVVHAVIFFATLSATKTVIEKRDPSFSASHVSTLEHVVLIAGVVIALVGAALFIWIARSCQSGKNWARVTGTVLCAIGVALFIYDLGAPEAVAARIFALVIVLIGLVAVVLLWLGSSSAYFKFFKRPQS